VDVTKTKNILIRVPINDMDDIGPEVGSVHRLRERGGEGREIEAHVTAEGGRWSNAITGQNGRWIHVEVTDHTQRSRQLKRKLRRSARL
jgi:hypothetical protein